MSDYSFDEILRLGIAAARAGDREQARRLLAEALRRDPQSESAWLWLSGVLTDRAERVQCLRRVLAINPNNETAQRGLQALGEALPAASPPPAAEEPPPAAESPAEQAPLSFVPVASPEGIERAQAEARAVADALAQRRQAAVPIQWGRGRRAVIAPSGAAARPALPRLSLPSIPPRLLLIGAGGLGALIVGLILFNLIGSIRRQQIVASFTATPSPTLQATATITVTPLPTRTPTPEGQPLTPEPTLPLDGAPRGDLRFGLTPTPPYIATPHPGSPLQDAQIAYYQGDYAQSLDLIEAARGEGDNTPDSYYFEAMALARLGRFEEAQLALNIGLEDAPNFAPLHAAQAYLFARTGAAERAQIANAEAQADDPDLADAYLQQAALFIQQGDLEAAAAELAALRARGRSDFDVRLLTAEADLARLQGEPERAVALANLAHYIDPANDAVIVALSRARLALGLTQSTIIGLENHLDNINPSAYEAWALLGQAYTAAGRPEDALIAFSRAVQLSEGASFEGLAGRGGIYQAAGDEAAALADFSAALALQDNPDLRRLRAQAALNQGDYETALADVSALRAASTEEDAALDVLYVQALTGQDSQPEEVIAVATRLLTSAALENPQRAAVLESRGRAHLAQSNPTAALQDLGQALELEATTTRYFYRAQALEAAGRFSEAARMYEFVITWGRSLGSPYLAEAEARLQAVEAAARATPTPAPTAQPTAEAAPPGG